MKNILYIWNDDSVIEIPSLPEAYLTEEQFMEDDGWRDTYPWDEVEDTLLYKHNMWVTDQEWFPMDSRDEVFQFLKAEISALEKKLENRKAMLKNFLEGGANEKHIQRTESLSAIPCRPSIQSAQRCR